MTHYSEITMTFAERAEFIRVNRHRYTPERLLKVTQRLNEDRANKNLAD